MTTYKIIVRNSPGWHSFEACTLGVSVTSPNWQGEYFASILDFAAAHFKTIRIDVTDQLTRHNLMAQGLPANDAAAQANRLGALWLERHHALIDACAVKPDVIRWGQWCQHPDYETVLEQFKRAHDILSPVLRDAVKSDTEGFLRRQGREPTDMERKHGRDYLIEEVAVNTLQARELSSLKLYPGDELLCLSVVRRGLVPDAPRGLEREQFAKVKFHTRGALKPANDLVHPPAPNRTPRVDRSNGAGANNLTLCD
jgi:tRNA-dependent cyclodipeptide synthase